MIYNKFSQEQINDIIYLYKKETPIDDIIKKYDTEERCIREILKDNQVDRQYNTFSEELYQRIIYLYRDKRYVYNLIEYHLLVSENGIRNILKKNNIALKSYSENNQKYKRDSYYFDSIDSENKAYYLGLLFADGNNFSGQNSITLSLQEDDGYLVEKLKKELKYEGVIHFDELSRKNPNYKNQVRIVINDEHMSKRLNSIGLVDNKSLILKFPHCINDGLKRHFIRGYFDGDGGVYYDKKRNRFTTNTTGTLEFVSEIQRMLLDIGCHSNIYHPKQSANNNTYILQTCGNKNSLLYLSWMYESADIKMVRKYSLYLIGKMLYGTYENLIIPSEYYK